MRVLFIFYSLLGCASSAWLGEEYWSTVNYAGSLSAGRQIEDFAILDPSESNLYAAFWITRSRYPGQHFEAFGYATCRPDGRICGWFVGYDKEPIESGNDYLRSVSLLRLKPHQVNVPPPPPVRPSYQQAAPLAIVRQEDPRRTWDERFADFVRDEDGNLYEKRVVHGRVYYYQYVPENNTFRHPVNTLRLYKVGSGAAPEMMNEEPRVNPDPSRVRIQNHYGRESVNVGAGAVPNENVVNKIGSGAVPNRAYESSESENFKIGAGAVPRDDVARRWEEPRYPWNGIENTLGRGVSIDKRLKK